MTKNISLKQGEMVHIIYFEINGLFSWFYGFLAAKVVMAKKYTANGPYCWNPGRPSPLPLPITTDSMTDFSSIGLQRTNIQTYFLLSNSYSNNEGTVNSYKKGLIIAKLNYST